MATTKSKSTAQETLDFIEVSQGIFEAFVVGDSPLIMNSMSAKVRHELLLPKGKKTAADKAASLKHEPLREWRDAMYFAREQDGPTLLMMPATAFKKAIMGAALDIPGAKKSQLGRLMYVVGDEVPIYGVPQVMMSVTRSADMNKTPDIRTRAILPNWCAKLTIMHTEPMLRGQAVIKLLAAGGMTQGIGDWRVEKGSGNFGRFSLAQGPDDPRWKLISDFGGRAEQLAALENPDTFDGETEALLEWYDEEVKRRGIRVA